MTGSVRPPNFTSKAISERDDLPGIAEAQPLVRDLDLPAVTNRLIEDPELVADAVADRRNIERRQRVHVTRGQPAQAAIA